MKTDIQISQSAKMEPIIEIASKLNLNPDQLELYGKYKAKIDPSLVTTNKNGKLILVTAISPTPLGEGKSTTTIGLVDSLAAISKNVVGALREPSLGPVFGVKGGAAGGGYAQVNPMADINLHFTGDLHAITSANNLISACIDNHIYHGNQLNLDLNRILWSRCLDLNDRALREVSVLATKDKTTRLDHFNITVASEIMAILCLATSPSDLKNRLDQIIIGYNLDGELVYLKDLGISGSVMVLLADAIKPNLVQTLENNPILIHGGPFANIAHGCNSIIATKLGLKLADYVVTEAGFGADLGAEKFLDIKCRVGSLKASAVVVVATIRALKYHGEIIDPANCLKAGIFNLEKHLDTIKSFGLPYVVALNKFESDLDSELEFINNWAIANNHPLALSEVFAKGSKGGIKLAQMVVEACEQPNNFNYLYQLEDDLKTKIIKVAQKAYGASSVKFRKKALEQLKQYSQPQFQDFFVCMAKTPLSLSDNPKLRGVCRDFEITIKEIRVSGGAKFLVCLAGDIMTMPGLPIEPLAKKIYLDDMGKIHNLS